MKAVVGEIWKSEILDGGEFTVVGTETALPGFDAWSDSLFVGYPAIRDDGEHALVALTKKPKDYPYDWVLTNRR